MTSIDFYFNASDRVQVACRLAGKASAQGQRLLIYAPDAEVAARLDRTLWTWPAIGFVPHCMVDHPLAPDTPVLIARDEQTPGQFAALLNLSGESPPHFARFDRLLEIVGTDESEREAARKRYRGYQSHGYAIANHDLGRNDE